MTYPAYSYPPGLLARVVRDLILMRRRDFHRDANACMEHLRRPLDVWGTENIPQRGPSVVTVNHYHRAGFGAQWLALAVAAVVPVPMHWIITAEWTSPAKWYRPVAVPASRLLLRKIAQLYGFTTMPPMPPRRADVEARAAAVRAVLDHVRHTREPVLGLAPEGRDPPSGVLTKPPPGLGRFALLLSKAGLVFYPVGAYEQAGAFHLRFGEPYRLSVRNDLPADEQDQRAGQIIMRNLACLLPLDLRGEFA